MKLEIARVDYWRGQVEDRPGALAEKLEPLAEGGTDLEFVIARRAPEQPGTGLVFVAPIKGARQTKTATGAGFEKAADIAGLRLETGNAAGIGAGITRALADGGINLRAMLGTVIGRKAVCYLAFDNSDDAAKAQKLLKKLG